MLRQSVSSHYRCVALPSADLIDDRALATGAAAASAGIVQAAAATSGPPEFEVIAAPPVRICYTIKEVERLRSERKKLVDQQIRCLAWMESLRVQERLKLLAKRRQQYEDVVKVLRDQHDQAVAEQLEQQRRAKAVKDRYKKELEAQIAQRFLEREVAKQLKASQDQKEHERLAKQQEEERAVIEQTKEQMMEQHNVSTRSVSSIGMLYVR